MTRVIRDDRQGLSTFGQGIPSKEGRLPDSQQVVGMQQDCQQGQPGFPTVTGKGLYNHLQGIECQYSPNPQGQEGEPDHNAIGIAAAQPGEEGKKGENIVHVINEQLKI